MTEDDFNNQINTSNSLVELENEPNPEPMIQSPDLERFQDNINAHFLPTKTEFNVSIFPLVYFHGYDNYNYYEYSNKCIAPTTFLRELSQYSDIRFPVHFTIENSNTVLAIHEFKDDIDSFYIPNYVFKTLDQSKLYDLDIPMTIKLVNHEFPKVKSLVLKPFRSAFLSIPDIKKYLEIHLKKGYSCLQLDYVIPICFRDAFLDFEVLNINMEDCESKEGGGEGGEVDTERESIYSLIDTDVEVILETPYDADFKCT